MFKKINSFREDELVRGSVTLVILIGIFNVLNYVFQMSMARMLGPADYGILAVLMSFVYIFGIPSEAIQTITVRYTSIFSSKKEGGKIKDLLLRGLKKGFIFSIFVFLVFVFLAIFLSMLLKIEFLLIFLTGILIFSSFEMPVLRGVLQGKKKFAGLGINLILESSIKVIFSILLVFWGVKVYGAMWGVLIGAAFAFLIGFFMVKDVLKGKRRSADFKGVYRYNLPMLISIISIVLMYSLDIILAKAFFSPRIAGQYAFVSLIGKTILFVSLAVGKTMFPISSERFAKGKKTHDLFKKSIIMVSLISVFALFFYFFFPEFVIKIISLWSTQYIEASNILFILGLAFSFTAVTNIVLLYGLSINKIKNSSFLFLLFVVSEVFLLYLFKSSILSFSISLMGINFVMMILSIYLIKK